MTTSYSQPAIQPTGFAFDSNDYAMNGMQTFVVFEHSQTPSMSEWDEEIDEKEGDSEEEIIPSKIDPDLEDEDGVVKEGDDNDEIRDDDDNEFEKYLHGDDD